MPLEHVWFWQPRADDPHCRHGDAAGLVVGKIIGKATATDINIEITHSVHPRFVVGTKCRRCRMKTRDVVLVNGVPQDRQSGKVLMPEKPEGKEVSAYMNEDADLTEGKYRVFKGGFLTDDAEVKNGFVLLPEKDPAALQALRAYVANCRSPVKKDALNRWVKKIEKEIVPKWQKGENLGSMGRINAGIDRLV
jgi:hypothetical protein